MSIILATPKSEILESVWWPGTNHLGFKFGRYAYVRIQRWGQRVLTAGQEPHVKSQVAICFFRNTGTDPLEKKLGPSGPIATLGRSVRSSLQNMLMT